MTVGETRRKQNKHRRIILKQSGTLSEDYTVVKAVNTIEALPRKRMNVEQMEDFLDRGFTVEITG